MGEIKFNDKELLQEAILLWSGFGNSPMPKRNDNDVLTKYGEAKGNLLLKEIQFCDESFYESKAYLNSSSLQEMHSDSMKEFQNKFPELPIGISEALAWC